MTKIKLGFECKLYIGTAGSAPSTEAKSVTDVQVPFESSAVDATTRRTGKFKTYIPGMIDTGLEFKIHADEDDSILSAIRTAYFNRGAIAIKVDLGDGYYFQSDMIVDNFSNAQSTGDIVAYDVKLKPTVTTDDFLPEVAAESSGSGSGGGSGSGSGNGGGGE